jgi:bifunctional non-homologous end joining protein LigD
VEHALKKKDAKLLVFESKQTLERVEKMGDLFAPLLSLKQKLPKLPGIAEEKAEAVAGLQMAAQAQSNKPSRAAKKKATAAVKRSSLKKTRQRI